MSSPISLFSGYSQSENRTTNYCLLLLRLLYEENPKFLEQALNTITGGQMGTLGVEFTQQERQENGIPDGVIRQSPFTIYIETKSFDWFHDDQLERHLDDLKTEASGQNILIALSSFEDGYEHRFDHVKHLCRNKYEGDIAFSALSFEEFLEAVRVEDIPKNVADHVDEFEAYLDQNDLLPNWKHMLDVCNCANTLHENQEYAVYICPAQGGAYSHKRARFFGAYKQKQAQLIAEIAGVVDVDPGEDGETTVLWNNRPDLYDRDELAREARRRKMNARPGISWSARTFVLEDSTPSAFRKGTSGGMINSKRYFDVQELDVSSAPELAEVLTERTWSEFE